MSTKNKKKSSRLSAEQTVRAATSDEVKKLRKEDKIGFSKL